MFTDSVSDLLPTTRSSALCVFVISCAKKKIALIIRLEDIR